MLYSFSKDIFIGSFNAKSTEEKSVDSIRITHYQDNQFKLFPYKAATKSAAPIVYDLEDVVSVFFRLSLNKKSDPIIFDDLCDTLLKNIEINETDIYLFKEIINNMFFKNGSFIANNIMLYPYQTTTNNKSSENLAKYLFSVLGINESDCKMIEKSKNNIRFSVLESMISNALESKNISDSEVFVPYFQIKTDIQDSFKNDLYFMLNCGMTSLEDMANLLSVYYFFYVSQTCIVLDKFFSESRSYIAPFYYALDWEKVSKNRLCCTDGWEKLQESIGHMFSHAITLEILNQTESDEMLDYISFSEMIKENPELDDYLSNEVCLAEKTYCSYIGDYKGFNNIPFRPGMNKTETAIMHLFKCVEMQFVETDRNRANQAYNEKFIDYCKKRWVKNRKKSGLVLNLSESDVIFLTKICLKNNEKIRLIDLYKEYEKRGIYLDNTSKELLQEFFTKLNLIDKKSDSGDAQYVKRIL